MDTSKLVTGQMIVMYKGDAPTKDGRKLYCIFGLVAVPEGELHQREDNGEQLTVLGQVIDGQIRLSLFNSGESNLTEEYQKGHTVGGLLTSPIWRV